ncbi:hypothetical protein TSO5_05820 [Azospirillum sp. TSO5]|nr:hypothetical protein TSO5_05820 [Azospirillum sp. TSO5]
MKWGGRAAAPAAPISGDFEQVLREMEGVAMEEDAASEFDDKQLDLIANWHDRLLASRVIATNKPTVAKANRAWVGSSAESTADGLCRELAAVLDENWIFLAVHAQSYAAGSGHPMALVHAEMLARVHAVMTKAHAAGYVPKANTTRLPVILAEHGYDAAALVSDGAKSSANNPVAPHQHIFP